MQFSLKVPFIAALVVALAIAFPGVAPALFLGALACALLWVPPHKWPVRIIETVYLVMAGAAAIVVLTTWLFPTPPR